MRKLLIIAYDFPPSATVAIYRPVKFAEYLPEFDWEPVVLTVSNGKFGKYDERMMKIVPEHARVYRAPSIEWLNVGEDGTKAVKKRTLWSRIFARISFAWSYLTIPDNKVIWVPFALAKAYTVVKREGIKDVFVTGKPFSSFITGYLLKKLCGTRLIIDYRDPWTQNINYERKSPIHARIDRALEQRIVRASDVVVANTRINEEAMVRDFGEGQDPEKFVTIHNGFDSKDFDGVPGDKHEKFTITYAGTFYFSVGSSYERSAGNAVMETYSPLYFLEALKQLIASRPDLKDKIQINFMGVLGHGYDPIIEEMGLSGLINRLGYVGYDEHLEVLKRSHALLLVLSRGEQSRGWIPSKFFSYMGSGNPVLALVPEGEVRDIIRATGAGLFVEPDDVDGTMGALSALYDRFCVEGGAFERDEEEVGKFERRHLTALLAQALDRRRPDW